MRALSISARRVLDWLTVEHLNHGGQENGKLVATYRQLARFGVTRGDIRKGFAELETAGFIRTTKQGMRQAGGGEPALYALTWLPTDPKGLEAAPPTERWKAIQVEMIASGVKTTAQARKWLAENLPVKTRTTTKKKRAVGGDIDSAPQMRAEDRSQLRVEKAGKVVPIRSHLRAKTGRK